MWHISAWRRLLGESHRLRISKTFRFTVFPVLVTNIGMYIYIQYFKVRCFILPFLFFNKVFGVFIAEPVSDILAAAITAIMLFTRLNVILDESARGQVNVWRTYCILEELPQGEYGSWTVEHENDITQSPAGIIFWAAVWRCGRYLFLLGNI